MATEFKNYKIGSEEKPTELVGYRSALVMFREEVPLITNYSCVSLEYLSILLMGLCLGISYFFIVQSICLLIMLYHMCACVDAYTHTQDKAFWKMSDF